LDVGEQANKTRKVRLTGVGSAGVVGNGFAIDLAIGIRSMEIEQRYEKATDSSAGPQQHRRNRTALQDRDTGAQIAEE